MVNIVRRQRVRIFGLEDSSKEVDRLIEGIDSCRRVCLGPQSIDHFIPRRGHARAGDEETDKAKDLFSYLRRRDTVVINDQCDAALILNEHRASKTPCEVTP